MRKWILAALFLLALEIFFLPLLVSTRIGKPFFIRALEEKSHGQIAIGELQLSWFGPQIFRQVHWTHESATGTAEELQIDAPFWSFSGPFHLKNGSISYKNGQIEQIEGQIIENDFQLTGVTLQGRVALQGKVYSKLHFHISVDIKSFPLLVLDQQLEQLFGPTLDLKGCLALEPEKEGTIDLTLASPNITAHLNGSLTQQAIRLRDPLTASIRITPALTSLLLKDANPLFLSSLEAENPITLQLDPRDSLIPIPFTLDKLALQGTLAIGKAHCEVHSSIQTVIHLFKGVSAPQIPIWLAPFPFRIAHGTLEAGRMDALLADSIHICTWGDIDLINHHVHMFLGIPSDTLRKAFGIKNLPDTYTLKVPIRGTTQEPDVVTAPAVTKIAALVAGKQISKRGFLGGLTDLFRPKEDEDVPPAHHPFPWE
jgi:hypothetical protein